MRLCPVNKLKIGFATFAVFVACLKSVSAQEGQASVYLSPAQGTFELGGTFDVSIFINSGGLNIEAVRVDLSFPADMVQIVDPTGGNSFISSWDVPPEYSNQDGTLSLEGSLLSPGINTEAGLVTAITFRARAPGEALISILDSSKVIANNGKEVDIPTSLGHGIYDIVYPRSECPIIFSDTHQDQNRWYPNNTPKLSWRVKSTILGEAISEEELNLILGEESIVYSWNLDHIPFGIPDNIAEGSEIAASYEYIENGVWYFHVKAQVEGVWSKTGHYVIRADVDPPSSFKPEIESSSGEESVRPLISFATTDMHSGIDHYEVRVESVNNPSEKSVSFIEASSPWQGPLLSKGLYMVIVRAYDKAGNWTDGVTEFEIGNGLSVKVGSTRVSLWLVIGPVGVIVVGVLLLFLVRSLRKKRKSNMESENVDQAGNSQGVGEQEV